MPCIIFDEPNITYTIYESSIIQNITIVNPDNGPTSFPNWSILSRFVFGLNLILNLRSMSRKWLNSVFVKFSPFEPALYKSIFVSFFIHLMI